MCRKARASRWLEANGRLTNKGQKLLASAGRAHRHRIVVPTETAPYYPTRWGLLVADLELAGPRAGLDSGLCCPLSWACGFPHATD